MRTIQKIGLLSFMLLVVACSSSKKNNSSSVSNLEGNWELTFITGPRITFKGLYPEKAPTLNIDVTQKTISGSTSCNNYRGKLEAEGSNISFASPMAMTKMACVHGNGEEVFLNMLSKVNRWTMGSDAQLQLQEGDLVLMKFTKK